jgi:hypothetical protein
MAFNIRARQTWSSLYTVIKTAVAISFVILIALIAITIIGKRTIEKVYAMEC